MSTQEEFHELRGEVAQIRIAVEFLLSERLKALLAERTLAKRVLDDPIGLTDAIWEVESHLARLAPEKWRAVR